MWAVGDGVWLSERADATHQSTVQQLALGSSVCGGLEHIAREGEPQTQLRYPILLGWNFTRRVAEPSKQRA